jgi:hypothetical protein
VVTHGIVFCLERGMCVCLLGVTFCGLFTSYYVDVGNCCCGLHMQVLLASC